MSSIKHSVYGSLDTTITSTDGLWSQITENDKNVYRSPTTLLEKRMDKLGYIKNIDGVVNNLNGKILEKIIIKNPSNSLNPTVCFVVSPPKTNVNYKNLHKKNIFAVPGTDFNITKIDNFYFSNATGLCFPILKSIPILKSNIAILASCLSN